MEISFPIKYENTFILFYFFNETVCCMKMDILPNRDSENVNFCDVE